MKIIGVIPARYQSSRFPGKPLCDICGKPMIWWVYQQCIKVLISLYAHQKDVIFSVFYFRKCSGCKVVPIMVLICISLMTNDFEHPFTCLLVICTYSLKKMSIQAIFYLAKPNQTKTKQGENK